MATSQQNKDLILGVFGLKDDGSEESNRVLDKAKRLREVFFDEVTKEDRAIISAYKTEEVSDGVSCEFHIISNGNDENDAIRRAIYAMTKHITERILSPVEILSDEITS